MARNLIGYFGSGSDCTQYSIKIIANPTSNTFEEIYLSGDSPVVVSYDTSKTPFDPIRLSRASINVVADNKLLDVFSADAHGTQVILETGNQVVWVGYLTNNLLNMPQDLCGYDSFSLEAQDCLYTLNKYYYETIGSKKSIVTFRQILGQIAEKCGLINTMYIDSSMLRSNGTYIEMGNLTISEQNFFSSDTDEPWTLREVLEELCKYLGYTAVQYKDYLYLYDMQSHSNYNWSGEGDATMIMNGFMYQKSTHWNSYTQGSFTNLAQGVYLRQGIVRGTGSDISLETIYQKVQVKDSFYEIDHFIPDFYDDKLLTNRDGDFWKCNQVSRTGQFKYINKKGKSKKEEKNENEHVYYLRKFNHKDYTSIYRDPSTLAEVTGISKIRVEGADSTERTSDYETGDGTYVVKATFTNIDTTSHSIAANAVLRYDWWDGEHQMPDYNEDSDSTSFTLAAGASRSITLSCSTWYDTTYRASPTYTSWYTIDGGSRTYGITNGTNDNDSNYIGATITDLATFDKPMNTTKYNYETESNISFERYIKIHQMDKPDRMHPYSMWLFERDQVPLNDNQIENVFPAIMKLNSGYVNPMIIDNKAYLALDVAAIYERYNVEYINPDWTDENSSMGMGLGLFIKTSSTTTIAPAMIFKLKIGNKYWSTHSGWTTTDSCFVVNLGTDKTDEDDTDFTGWWNEEHPALNNIDWTDWAGVSGYKIPLDTTLDFTGDIGFWIMMPSKIQEVDTREEYDGMNNYCWVKDLNIKFATKMSENYDLADVLYENIIDSGSTNTLSDITVKCTTYPGEGMHSYSSVALDGVLLTTMKKTGLDDIANLPEENIIKAYTNQYSTPTIKQTMTLESYISPFSYLKDPTLDNRLFGILGTSIDYAKNSQTLYLVEVKPWSL